MFTNIALQGTLKATKIPAERAPLQWRVSNALRPQYWGGWMANSAAKLFSKVTRIPTLTAELSARAFIGGRWVDYGVISYRVVTDAGAAYIVDDFDNASGSADISLFNFHGCGTGTGSEATGDTALGNESTTALNPNDTRATGTRSQPTAVQYRSAGTLTFDASAAVTEHGLFTTSGTGTGTLLDRSVFSAINVASGDTIAFQYTLSVNSGG